VSTAEAADPPATSPGPPAGRERGDLVATLVRGTGQALITVGVVALLLVVYQLWVTNLFTTAHQHQLVGELEQQWREQPAVTPPLTPSVTPPGPASPPAAGGASSAGTGSALPAISTRVGHPFALLHIPRLDGNWAVVEGVAQVQLAQGPGHYVGTALPGAPGNFAVAGHAIRSVFLSLADLRPGDPVVVETGSSWFVYRVLGDPATGDFGSDPSGIPGREIVLPNGVQVISPTPDQPADAAATGAYLTLTTCTPATTATHRLIVHARLDGQPISKASAPNGPPALRGT
jgi:sortase A